MLNFLNPLSDPDRDGYQSIQAMMGFARGGIAGVGLGKSRQKWGSLPEAHTFATGAGQTVAVLDTGLDAEHPHFAGRIAPGGYNFVDGSDGLGRLDAGCVRCGIEVNSEAGG